MWFVVNFVLFAAVKYFANRPRIDKVKAYGHGYGGTFF